MHRFFRFSCICLLVALLNPSTIFSQEIPKEDQKALLEAIAEAEEKKTADEGEDSFKEVIPAILKALRLQQVPSAEQDCIDPKEICVFGYDLFRSAPTTFALSSDIPVPPSYTLGPGDELRIEYYGNENFTKQGYITRTGTLHLPILGPVTLAGLTFSEAEALVTKKVGQELIGTDVFMTLGELRSISIYVLGAAYQPGTYTISGLSTLTNALFASGGVNKVGSVRNIQVKRKGKVIKTFDLYDLLLKGDTSSDTRLQQGDTIFIPLIKETIRIQGQVLRPGHFEIKKGERLKDVLAFSGEVSPKARIELNRVDYETLNRRAFFFSLDDKETLNLEMQRGDSINVVENISLVARNVLLSGEFHYPGSYSINVGDTLYDLIMRAGGYTDEAYSPAAVFTRVAIAKQQKESYIKSAESLEKALIDSVSRGQQIDGEAYLGISSFIKKLKAFEPIGRQEIDADLLILKTDPVMNLTMQDGDALFVPKRPISITVVGEVLNATSLTYAENLSLEDYIKMAGGMTAGADKQRIFIILPDGSAVPFKRGIFSRDVSTSLMPGSIVVVSRDPDPFNWLFVSTIVTPILSDLAMSIAAITTISNN